MKPSKLPLMRSILKNATTADVPPPDAADIPDRLKKRRNYRVNVSLRGLGPRLQALADRRQMSMGALIREAILPWLAPVPTDADDLARYAVPDERKIGQAKVNFTARQFAKLSSRAAAAGLFKGDYLSRLIDEDPPPPQPEDMAQLTATLTQSTDRLAAISVDLNALMGRLGDAPTDAELLAHQRDVELWFSEIRAHLRLASKLAAVLEKTKRPPR